MSDLLYDTEPVGGLLTNPNLSGGVRIRAGSTVQPSAFYSIDQRLAVGNDGLGGDVIAKNGKSMEGDPGYAAITFVFNGPISNNFITVGPGGVPSGTVVDPQFGPGTVVTPWRQTIATGASGQFWTTAHGTPTGGLLIVNNGPTALPIVQMDFHATFAFEFVGGAVPGNTTVTVCYAKTGAPGAPVVVFENLGRLATLPDTNVGQYGSISFSAILPDGCAVNEGVHIRLKLDTSRVGVDTRVYPMGFHLKLTPLTRGTITTTSG